MGFASTAMFFFLFAEGDLQVVAKCQFEEAAGMLDSIGFCSASLWVRPSSSATHGGDARRKH